MDPTTDTMVSSDEANEYAPGTVVLSAGGAAYQRAPSPPGRPQWWFGGRNRPVPLRDSDGPFRVLHEVMS